VPRTSWPAPIRLAEPLTQLALLVGELLAPAFQVRVPLPQRLGHVVQRGLVGERLHELVLRDLDDALELGPPGASVPRRSSATR
jgi:hypothetical protein